MEVTVGAILEGKVTGITKFGAFVALPDGRSGLVHISNLSYDYVNDVSDVVTVGQTVRVKVLNIDERNERINLSVKHAQPRGQRPVRESRPPREPRSGREFRPARGTRAQSSEGNAARESQSFEDKLKQYMAESERKLSQLGRHNDRGGRGRRRR